jgi:hypothetical protein
MSNNFQIDYRKSDGDLFVRPMGDLDGSSACELVNMIHDQYDGTGQVVVETDGLCAMCPFGCSVFKCQLSLVRFPVRRICFRGLKGREIAPEGSSVRPCEETPSCRCGGNCVPCKGAENAPLMKQKG